MPYKENVILSSLKTVSLHCLQGGKFWARKTYFPPYLVVIFFLLSIIAAVTIEILILGLIWCKARF